MKTSSNSRWKFGDSEADIGGTIQAHSASTGQPFFSSEVVHLWNFWAAVWWSSIRMPALSKECSTAVVISSTARSFHSERTSDVSMPSACAISGSRL